MDVVGEAAEVTDGLMMVEGGFEYGWKRMWSMQMQRWKGRGRSRWFIHRGLVQDESKNGRVRRLTVDGVDAHEHWRKMEMEMDGLQHLTDLVK